MIDMGIQYDTLHCENESSEMKVIQRGAVNKSDEEGNRKSKGKSLNREEKRSKKTKKTLGSGQESNGNGEQHKKSESQEVNSCVK